eukprot:CAMPEP_0202916302 /NCGR_PEP_ID=MMETSP1392-20130828/68250_1 /ASSEMBLY_ACC=CAM_ASM_000868 /TAXON_ID=225041 /ORGANISM="Chlamydomonas chlamydogama, Strain SAG 11-48b" /LENGTH=49 /DNA_ID= /DNA_START= /DNA_END= /DNA_ORIENTATION=
MRGGAGVRLGGGGWCACWWLPRGLHVLEDGAVPVAHQAHLQKHLLPQVL